MKELQDSVELYNWLVPLCGPSHSGERETRHDLPHRFSFFTRTNGMTGRSIAYVIGADGELVEPSESGYRRDDDKTWGPEVLDKSMVILTHKKAYTPLPLRLVGTHLRPSRRSAFGSTDVDSAEDSGSSRRYSLYVCYIYS